MHRDGEWSTLMQKLSNSHIDLKPAIWPITVFGTTKFAFLPKKGTA